MSASPWYASILRCPDCLSARHPTGETPCSQCGFQQEMSRDWRAKSPASLTLELQRTLPNWPTSVLEQIPLAPPEMTYQGPPGKRDSRHFMSLIAQEAGPQKSVLDLGCGPRDQATPLEYLGFQYVGLDYDHKAADVLGDAHALPFADCTFDVILSYAVLEHLHSPWVAIREVQRVLKPGGIYIGSVSQGEPYHQSFFHHTPWAIVSLIGLAPALKLERLWPGPDALRSLSRMGRYPRLIQGLLKGLYWLNESCPWLAPRKMRWPDREKQLDRLYRAGSVSFCVRKVPVAT